MSISMSLVNDSHILEYICKLCNFPYLYDDRESLFTDIERLHSFLDKNTDRYNSNVDNVISFVNKPVSGDLSTVVNNYIHNMNKHDSFLCKYTNNDECIILNIYHIYRNMDDDGNKYDHANIIAQITVHDKLWFII